MSLGFRKESEPRYGWSRLKIYDHREWSDGDDLYRESVRRSIYVLPKFRDFCPRPRPSFPSIVIDYNDFPTLHILHLNQS